MWGGYFNPGRCPGLSYAAPSVRLENAYRLQRLVVMMMVLVVVVMMVFVLFFRDAGGWGGAEDIDQGF